LPVNAGENPTALRARLRGSVPVESTRETVTAFLKDLSERGPSERHFATDVTFMAVDTGQVIVGRTAVARSMRHFLHETFNARLLIKAALIDDEQASVEADFVGTHRGMFRGIAATGREVSVPCSLAFRLRDGAIVALHGYLPVGQLLCQIGTPTPTGER
jgi:predicted ester cyclase